MKSALANPLRLVDMSAAFFGDCDEIIYLSGRGLIFFASSVRVRR